MGVPSSIEARLFYRCAIQRFEEAQILLRSDRTTGAVYLAGYGIECILKSLLLSVVVPGRTVSVLQSFRGNRAHDYEWLREQYFDNQGPDFPRGINLHFTLVSDWSTNLRYIPRKMEVGDAEDFLAAAEAIIQFVIGRL
jgi:HEPN domain-containing protein